MFHSHGGAMSETEQKQTMFHVTNNVSSKKDYTDYGTMFLLLILGQHKIFN